MSVFQPMDPRVGNDRRKALLARLSGQQPGFNSANALNSALSPLRASMGMAGSGRSFHAAGDLQAGPHTVVTQQGPGIGALLRNLLGPGGMSRPIPGNFGQGPGGVLDHMPIPGGPPGLNRLADPGPSHPIPPVDNTPVGGQGVGPRPQVPITPAPAAPGLTGASLVNAPPATAVPIGSGMLYDPVTDTLHSPGGGGGGAFRE